MSAVLSRQDPSPTDCILLIIDTQETCLTTNIKTQVENYSSIINKAISMEMIGLISWNETPSSRNGRTFTLTFRCWGNRKRTFGEVWLKMSTYRMTGSHIHYLTQHRSLQFQRGCTSQETEWMLSCAVL